MQNNLVIVESPAKAKTIEKFLGKDFKVMSSYGHIRDLKKKEISIDLDSLTPFYEIPEEKQRLVSDLKKNAKAAATVWALTARTPTALCSTRSPSQPFSQPSRTRAAST